MQLEELGWNGFFAGQNHAGVPGRVTLRRTASGFWFGLKRGEVDASVLWMAALRRPGLAGSGRLGGASPEFFGHRERI